MARLRAVLYRVHRWAGFNLGFLLLVICASGTVATLSHEIDWLLHPEMRVSPVEGGAMRPLPELVEVVRQAYPGEPVTEVHAPRGPRTAASVALALPLGPEQSFVTRRVHVDPWTGSITGETNPYFSVQHHFRVFHKQFFIYGSGVPHGTIFVGFWGLILLLSAVTGIIVYRRWLANLFCIRLEPGRRFWSDAHRLAGVWGLLFSVVIGVTGVWYWADQLGFAGAVGLSADAEVARIYGARSDPTAVSAAEARGPVDLERALASVRAQVPDFEPVSALFPVVPQGALILQGTGSGMRSGLRAAGFATVDPWTAEVVALSSRWEPGVTEQAVHSVSPLHFGTFAGMPVKVAWFVLGLILCGGIVAGVRIWSLRVARLSGGTNPTTWSDRWLGLAPTLALVAAAIWFTTVHVGVRVVPADWEAVGVGSAEVGPWRVDLLEERREGEPTGIVVLRARDALTGAPALLERFRLGGVADGGARGLATARVGARTEALSGSDAVEEGACLELVAVDGTRASGTVRFDGPPPPDVRAAGIHPRVGVTAVGLLFAVSMLVTGAWWFRLYRPRGS